MFRKKKKLNEEFVAFDFLETTNHDTEENHTTLATLPKLDMGTFTVTLPVVKERFEELIEEDNYEEIGKLITSAFGRRIK